jgi:hypothetical protein
MNALVPRFAMAVALALASFPLPAAGRQDAVVSAPATLGVTATVRQPGTVTGVAWHRDNTPVSHALLRLRDVTAGRIVTGTQADAAGRFAFQSVPSGSYLVELVDEDGAVRGVGQMFSVGPGETSPRSSGSAPTFPGTTGSSAMPRPPSWRRRPLLV